MLLMPFIVYFVLFLILKQHPLIKAVIIRQFIATNQRVVAAKRQQRGLVAVTIRGSVLFYSSAI